ncbi:hypothetical protein D3C81_1640060 [compost metagenome]
MTCLPFIYSMIALSPLASDKDRCNVARRCSPGGESVTRVNGSSARAFTASSTVAKLSSMYCVHAEMLRPGLPLLRSGYSDSASHNRFATRPVSFMPSVVAKSYAAVTTLP